jgi:uncharacterized protein
LKFHLASPGGNVFTAHGPGFVRINQREVRTGVIVTADEIVEGWAPAGFGGLTAADFEQLVRLDPEVVLLGTGRRQAFPTRALTVALIEARVGLEVMDTGAACRTFNILSAEGRRVAAALLID